MTIKYLSAKLQALFPPFDAEVKSTYPNAVLGDWNGHVFTLNRKRYLLFYLTHADSKTALKVWMAKIKEITIQNLNDLKQVANSVDVIGNNRVIFNIKGNKYRIITVVLVHRQIVYIRWIGSYAEYDKVDAHTV